MEIKTSKYLISNNKVEMCPKPSMPEFAFIGRSNVGKSSLINMLTGNAKLAKTSKTPGKTQMINHFVINDNFYLVDLPGYGYAKRSQAERQAWEVMIEKYMRQRENLVCVMVLIDSRHEPQNIDLAFLRDLGEWQVPFNIIFTKADKTTQKEAYKHARMFVNAMRDEWEFIPRSFMTSAEKYLGKNELLTYMGELITEWNAQGTPPAG
ncbi:MAG: YihA family ribosome biogenesis GTP-binding protein [Chitinophagia bacterium]|nr:YihA family ribosome biogenesis GTP-binding protein [Chitinophagia bacterium]